MLTAAASDARHHASPSVAGATPVDRPAGYRIPLAPPLHGQQHWVPPGHAIRVAGAEIPGMVYAGIPPLTKGKHYEPSLIDPGLPVAEFGTREVKRGLWITYAALTPQERRGYVNWLASGKTCLEVDIRFVFLYFYGLERRLLIDSKLDPMAAAEAPAIVAELHHLIEHYGRKDSSFGNAAAALIYWVENDGCPPALYSTKAPAFLRVYGLKTYTQIAVGQSIASGVPLSAKLALAWLLADGIAYVRDIVKAHRADFDRLYQHLYEKAFGQGVVPQRGSVLMKLQYRASSPGLVENPLLLRDIGDVPDPSQSKASLDAVKAVFDEASAEIERFARLMDIRAGNRETLDVLSQLPMPLWAHSPRAVILALCEKVQAGPIVIRLSELLVLIDKTAVPGKHAAICVSRVLDDMGVAIEYELSGGRGVKADQLLVLFPTPPEHDPKALHTSYRDATNALALAMVAVTADGPVSEAALRYLRGRLDEWPDATLRSAARLRAHLLLIASEPAPLPAVKKRLGKVTPAQAEQLAALAVGVVVAAGEPSPAAMKALARIYKALELDPKRATSDAHATAAGGGKSGDAGFSLNRHRIAALQIDTAKVSALLSGIFRVEDAAQAVPAPEARAPQAQQAVPERLLGLDPQHASMARQILAKASWTRAELLALASPLNLMLDGALERINDAAFDAHDIPFTEGEDPVETNPEIMEILK